MFKKMHLSKDINNSLKEFISKTQLYRDIYRPIFYRIYNDEEERKLAQLLEEKPFIQLFDTIYNQLKDLVKSLNPSIVFNEITLKSAIDEYLDGADPIKYGVWVYYPWLEKVVHILDEQEYILVRTTRNKQKITQAEQEILLNKTIGVIGLSVGQSVSLTLAMERGCGELRIADFDVLDLTNINRIRSGVQNIDLKKTVIVAREIAEIDPFLKVSCFHEGITEDNIDDFLQKGKPLDLLIDECDGIDVKVMCRLKAKQYKIPVLMEASDRGTIDIERFDLEPDRPILHGLIEHLDTSRLKHLKTNEEKIPYILPIAGVETLSTRMKASMIEVQQTITSWPQLASAVTYGGGITADLSRKILLDQLHVSGRYFIDIDELIADNLSEDTTHKPTIPEGITFKEISDIARDIDYQPIQNQKILEAYQLDALLKTAQRASSAGNNQPWKWHYTNNSLLLFHDRERSFSFANHKNIVAFVGFGLAIESIRLKAETLGLTMSEQLFPTQAHPDLIAILQFADRDASKDIDALAMVVDIRHTSRNIPKERKEIHQGSIAEMTDAVSKIKDAKLYVNTNEHDVNSIAEIMGASDRLRMFTPTGHYELFDLELRWTKEESVETGDGLDLSSFDLSPGEAIGMRIAKDPAVINLLKEWKGGTGLEKLSRKSAAAASAIGLITMPGYTAKNFIDGGKATERVWLAANKAGISIQPMTASIYHFNILKYGNELENDPYLKNQFMDLNTKFKSCFPKTGDNEVPIFLFRLFYDDQESIPSQRLNIDKIFSQNITR